MAITKTIEIKVEAKKGIKTFDKLGDSIVDTKNDIINLERQLIKLERQLAKTNDRDFKGRQRLNRVIDKTKQSIKEEKNALKSLTVQRGAARTAARAQLKANKGLNKEYFKSKESLTDLNRLTAEFALKVKAVKNLFLGSIESIKAYAKAQKLVFIGTGIGIFLIALGLIAANWGRIKDFVSGVNRDLVKQGDLIQKNLKFLGTEISLNEAQIKLGLKRGENIDNLLETQKLLNIEKRKELALNIGNAEAELVQAKIQQERFDLLSFVTGGRFTNTQKRIDKVKELGDEILKATELLTVFDTEQEKDPLKKDATTTSGGREVLEPLFGGLRIGDRHIVESKIQMEDELAQVDIDARTAEFARKLDHDNALRILSQQKQEEDIKDKADEEERDKIIQQTKIALALNTFSLIGALSKRGSAVAKGVAVAQTTIATIEGTINTFKSAAANPITKVFPPFPFIQAGIAAAFGALQIKKILSTDPSGGGGVPSANIGGQASAPSFNLVAGSGTNQIAEGLANQPTPLRAFVVSSEVTNAQSLDRNIEDEGSI